MTKPQAPSVSYFTPLFIGFAVLGCLQFGIFGFLQQQKQDYAFVRESAVTRQILNNVLSTLQGAENEQRGYLLTGDRRYLASFDGAGPSIENDFRRFSNLQVGSLSSLPDLGPLRRLIEQKLSELRTTVNLEMAGKHAEARAIVEGGTGMSLMGQIRAQTDELLAAQLGLMNERLNWAESVGFWLRYGALASFFLAAVLAFVAVNQLRRRLANLTSASDDLVTANAEVVTGVQHGEQLSEQLRQSQKMEAIGQLTGGLAHDFNNMLAVIVGSLNLTKRRLARGETDVGRYLDSAMDGAERATKLTNRLLAFSRQQPLAPVALDPNRMVAGMAELLRGTLSDNVLLETVLAGGLWRALADPNQLENSILNIAINARDAMPDGGKLTIETSNAFLDDDYAAGHFGVAAGQYVLICVTDTGMGMTSDVLAKVFDPFFTTKPPGKGTGLGLSQVFGFVKQSGGHVAIYSELGRGTTIKVYLPRSYRENEVRGTSRIAVEAFPAGKTSEIVLVAEDDERVIQLTVDTLRELGYTVLYADSGPAALAQLDAAPQVDLLFTDIVMPGMDGRKLAEEALKRRPDLKVLFTTGYAPNSVVHNGTLDYGEDLISKPYSIEQLASKIRDVLDRPRVTASIAAADIFLPGIEPTSMETKWKH
jgi:signal transduction histidine kinase/CheY-like chemotaxis protein